MVRKIFSMPKSFGGGTLLTTKSKARTPAVSAKTLSHLTRIAPRSQFCQQRKMESPGGALAWFEITSDFRVRAGVANLRPVQYALLSGNCFPVEFHLLNRSAPLGECCRQLADQAGKRHIQRAIQSVGL